MKKLILVAFMLMACVSLSAQLNEVAQKQIKDCAKAKWAPDYEMVEYEFKVQLEAANEFMNLFKQYNCVNTEHNDLCEECLIMVRAFAEWSDELSMCVQWDMVLYETKNQIISYKNMKE